jgi:hypothetical protein
MPAGFDPGIKQRFNPVIEVSSTLERTLWR